MISPASLVVFDLDDTLYPEADYARSALNYAGQVIAEIYGLHDVAEFLQARFENGSKNPLNDLWHEENLPATAKADILSAMRAHKPSIFLPDDSARTLGQLRNLGIKWAILTDGRGVTQRQKIRALGLCDAAGIFISEETGAAKPTLRAFTQISERFPESRSFIYIADNPQKDFVTPNALGWKTYMLRDQGRNIHSQRVSVPTAFQAEHCISNLTEIFEAPGSNVRQG